MHILRWLFSHPVIFAWALAILAILLNYGVGGGAKEEAHAEGGEATEQHAAADNTAQAVADTAAVAAVTTEQAATEVKAGAETAVAATEQVATEAAETVVATAEQATTEVKAVAETAGATTEQVATEAVETVAATTEQVAQAATDTAAKTATAAVTAVAATAAVVASSDADAKAADATQAAAATEEAADTTGTTEAAQEAAPASAQDLLLAAREAYWSEDFERSAEFYQALLAQDDQPSYKGELANVFWKQGNSAEAVKLYSDIAVWLKDQGRMAELQNIKVYIDLVDPAVGEQIGNLLK